MLIMSSTSLHPNLLLFVENTVAAGESQNPRRRLCCEKCRFSTKDPELFERHSANHKEVTFSCTLCEHVSFSRVESQRHAVTHRGAFPYRCSWCPYGAVRRDYVVKHMQRIHAKAPDFSDSVTPGNKTEPQRLIKNVGLGVTRTSDGPSRDMISVSGLIPTQSRSRVPYLLPKSVQQPIRNQTCITATASPSVPKPHPYILPSSVCHPASPVTTTVPPRVLFSVSPVGEHDRRNGDKLSPVNNITTSVLPRVNINVPTVRSPHKKLPSAHHTEKNVLETKMIRKIHVALPVPNNKPSQTQLSKPREAPMAQTPASCGVIRNPLVLQAMPKSIPAATNPNTSGQKSGQKSGQGSGQGSDQGSGQGSSQGCGQSGSQVPMMLGRQKLRANILPKAPTNKDNSSLRSGVKLNLQPSRQDRTTAGSSVQVELLEPLHQPLQHNKPLMVSCPEEINIPAGCLVELVEVKNVNGVRELELRLVPQQLGILNPQESSGSSATTDASERMSFKCRVAPGNQQQAKPSGLPEPPLKGTDLRSLHTDVQVPVKREPELNLLCSNDNQRNPPGPSGSQEVTQESLKCDVRKIRGAVCRQKHLRNKMTSRGGKNPNKTKHSGSNSEVFPVISSVFSLCHVPQTKLSPTSENVLKESGKLEQLSDPSHSGHLRSTENWRVYRLDPKTESKSEMSTRDSTQTLAPSSQKKEEPEDTRTSTDVKLEKSDLKSAAEQKSSPDLSTSSDVPPRDPAPNVPQKKNLSLQLENVPAALKDHHSMNPIVSLIRIPDLESFSPSRVTPGVSGRIESEESVTARPVLCRPTDNRNLQERSIKLVLKRKRAEMNPTSGTRDSQLDLLYVDFLPDLKKSKRSKKRSKKCKTSTELQSTGENELWLTPLKPDQPIRRPGPEQPVVVLNHPNPRITMDSPALDNFSSITTTVQTEQPAPAFKMTLKKVQGRGYEVTELLLKGVSEQTTLERHHTLWA